MIWFWSPASPCCWPEASKRPVATSVMVTRAPPTSSPSTIAPCATTRTITSVATGSVRSRGGLSSAAYATLIMNSALARKGDPSFFTTGSLLLLLTFPRYSKSGGLADPLIRASYCLLGQCSIGRVPVLVLLLPLPPLSGQEARWPQTARVQRAPPAI